MSNSRTASRKQAESNAPRAVIHKQILDVAASRPDESMEAIADDVTGATTAIVERVLEEYGDPCRSDPVEEREAAETNDEDGGVEPDAGDRDDDHHEGSPRHDGRAGDTEVEDERLDTVDGRADEAESAMSEHDSPIETTCEQEQELKQEQKQESTLDPTSLTPKQLETVREIHRSPAATQAELADTLGVTSATISQRVNSIDGFDWSNRRELVDPLFEDGSLEASPEDARRDSTVHAGGVSETNRDDGRTQRDTGGANSDRSETHRDRSGPNSAVNETETGRSERSAGEENLRDELSSNSSLEASSNSSPGDTHGSDSSGEIEGTTDQIDDVRIDDTDESAVATDGNGTNPTGALSSSNADRPSDRSTSPASEPLETLTERVETLTEQLETLTDQVGSLAAQVDTLEGEGGESVRFGDAEFVHKVLHACLSAENISEDEELELLKEVTDGGSRGE